MDLISRRLSKGFDQVKQFASEKIGTAEETTEFPLAYQQLDQTIWVAKKVDQVKVFFDGLLRVTGQLLHADDYAPPITESFLGAMEKINEKIRQQSGTLSSTLHGAETRPNQASAMDFRPSITIHQATADICINGADILSSRDTNSASIAADPPAANLLQKYAQAQSKLSQARQDFNFAIEKKFVEPFSTYHGAYDQTNKARRNAQLTRLELDACKNKLRASSGPKQTQVRFGDYDIMLAGTGAVSINAAHHQQAYVHSHLRVPKVLAVHQEMVLQTELTALETNFITACDEAIKEMHNFIQYAESTHCIEMLVEAQYNYYRKASEILGSMAH